MPQMNEPDSTVLNERDSTVFVVDDDDPIRKALARLLRSAGHKAATFGSARELLGAPRASDASACLVLDVQMPELTGIDVQRELQAGGTVLPIVFLTGHGDIPMTVGA